MKIGLVSPYDHAFPGGVTGHVTRLGENLVRMGHEVKIIAPSSSNQGTEDNSNLIVLGKPVPIPASGSIVRISVSPRLAGPVKRILDKERFDIIHLHEPLLPAVPLSVLRFSRSINMGTFHAFRGKSRGYFYTKYLLNRWFRKLDGKIAVSKPAMEFVGHYFPGCYTIIPNGIDLKHFSADVPPIEDFCDGKLNILFVGRLEKRKGLKYLLGAYRHVKNEFPDLRLIVVGPDGGLRQKCEKIISRRHIEDVIFADYVSYEELPRYFKSADLFCAPATDKESFGIVLLEAMAAGKPIVASNIQGYAGVVKHGAEGLLVQPRDEEDLTRSLLRLLKDETLRQQMGVVGKITAEGYSWERVSRKVVDYYETVIQQVARERLSGLRSPN